MKTRSLQSLVLAITSAATVTFLTGNTVAQGPSTSTITPAAAQPATTPQAAPQLSYGVAQVVQLAHANVGEDVIVNYIQGSGNAYGLDANQIVYLKQQGISDRIINEMLNQRSRVAATTQVAQATQPVQAAPQPGYSDAGGIQAATVAAQPSYSYVQTAQPSSTVYVIPDTQTYNYYAYSYPYYYPYYYGWPAVSFSFGYYSGGCWGGYHGCNNGWHGGGWHGGGGGWHGGGGGGGWHGGGGGGHH